MKDGKADQDAFAVKNRGRIGNGTRTLMDETDLRGLV
jgi:hypothetical protein